jgi:hypothetical protein
LYEIKSVLKEIKRVVAPGRFAAMTAGTAFTLQEDKNSRSTLRYANNYEN